MKPSKTRKLFLLLISVSLLIPQGVASADTKKVGRTNTPNIVNTILSGKGAPSASLGNNGDFYIDKVNLNFYGPKAKDLWPLPVSMRGPAGPSGVDGKNGSDGKNGVTTVAAGGGSSSPGAQGPAGPKGDTGPAGPKGDTGDTGAQGPAGSAGPAGATGASGATGPVGPQGAQGIQGDVGPQGPQGAQGIQGIPGVANNPLKVVDLKSGALTSWSINLSAGSSASSDFFGSLTAGNSYRFTVILKMRTTSNILSSTSAFGAYLQSDISGANPTYATSIGYGRFLDETIAENKYQITFIMTGGITVPAGSALNLKAYFTDVNGFTTVASNSALSGKALFEQVSSIS
jgi:hypothetical protein